MSKLLEKTQREALLIITHAYKSTSDNSLRKEIGIQTLEIRRTIHRLVFIYKTKNQLLPNYLMQLLTDFQPKTSNQALTNLSNLRLPIIRKNYFLKSFIPSSIKDWNTLNIDKRR